jgi:hypothetical protein
MTTFDPGGATPDWGWLDFEQSRRVVAACPGLGGSNDWAVMYCTLQVHQVLTQGAPRQVLNDLVNR